MNINELKKYWESEEKKTFKGWDFSYLDNRAEDEDLPWDYQDIILSYQQNRKRILDMGTGGGEFLISLLPSLTGERDISATEAYPPNIELSKSTLTPYGIKVYPIEDDQSELPFTDSTFDLIINRHESFSNQEVYRILKPVGVFITQQVGGKNNRELSEFLLGKDPGITDINFNLENVVEELKTTGFTIQQADEYYPWLRFYDIGALVYFAKIIEWEFPGFTVEKCFDRLYELQQKVNETGYIESMEHRFIIVASK